jgi:hypothetical protein
VTTIVSEWRKPPRPSLYTPHDRRRGGHGGGVRARGRVAAGKSPSRASVLAIARRLVEANKPFLVPGVVVRGGRVQQVALQRWVGGRWSVFTGPIVVTG